MLSCRNRPVFFDLGRDLAADQEHQNILMEYQLFLANLIINYGTNLSGKPEAKLAAQFMTVTALRQLDANHKSILLRSLFHSKFITLPPSAAVWATSVIDLRQVDLSNTVFGLPADVQNLRQRVHFVPWEYLGLPFAILTNASFRCASLDCAQFDLAIMDSADLSFTYHANPRCRDSISEGQTSFAQTSLVRASFYKAEIRFTSFDYANLSFANMYRFYCMHCTFSHAVLDQADLSFSFIYNYYISHPGRLNFISASFSRALLHSARYLSINFDGTDWSNARATQLFMQNCTFTNATLNNCSFANSYMLMPVFENASLRMVDFSNATLQNVSFINSDMSYADLSSIRCEYCHFINVTLYGAVMKNASFRYSHFLDCDLNASQLEEIIDLSGSAVSNYTVIANRD